MILVICCLVLNERDFFFLFRVRRASAEEDHCYMLSWH